MDNLDEFVEGHITGIVLRDQDKVVDIYLTDHSHRKHILTAFHVSDMRIWEMRDKNIIDRISIWGASSHESEYGDRLSFLIYGAEATKNKGNPSCRAVLDKAAQSIRDGRTVLLDIEPVYGALVLILAEKIVMALHE